MPAEHYRLNADGKRGLYHGYFCAKCGAGGMSMYGHDTDKCESNPELVKELVILNK